MGPRYKIIIAFGEDAEHVIYDYYAFLITPQEPIHQPLSATQYAHFAEVFDKLGSWFRAMRIVYTLCGMCRGVSPDWRP